MALADVYQYGSEVRMGTARLQKENEEQSSERRLRLLERKTHRRGLERRLAQARAELQRLTLELAGATEDDLDAERLASDQRQGIRERRASLRPAAAPGEEDDA